MDEKGNISECADHIQSDGARDDWYDRCWDSFYRDIIIKTEDWEYEQEWRLILADKSGKFDEEENRTLFYNFNSLKGIIFGIKTAHEDKLRIVKLIQKKVQEKATGQIFKFLSGLLLARGW